MHPEECAEVHGSAGLELVEAADQGDATAECPQDGGAAEAEGGRGGQAEDEAGEAGV